MQFLDLAYLLGGRLPRDRRRAAVEQNPQPIQPTQRHQTTVTQWETLLWWVEVEKRPHEAAGSELAKSKLAHAVSAAIFHRPHGTHRVAILSMRNSYRTLPLYDVTPRKVVYNFRGS